jgi:hypothetical protein
MNLNNNIFNNLLGGNKQNTLSQFSPQNPAAFMTIMLGVIIFGISIGFVCLRIPDTTLPTSDELDNIEIIKKNKPPHINGLLPIRDSVNPFPTYYPATLNANEAYNKSDFNNLYNNYIKPNLEANLLNNQKLLINKSSKLPDIMVSFSCAFFGLTLIYLGITFYTKKIQSFLEKNASSERF